MKIRPVGAEMLHANGDCDSYPSIHPSRETDIHNEANSRFCNFGRALNK
jgi:hypothetical protein